MNLRDPQLEETPFALFLDFATAFPSVSREYVLDALAAAGVPRHLLRVTGAMYTAERSTIGTAAPTRSKSFSVESGVPQGCPLSGSTFCIASVPLLVALAAVVGRSGVFAFADDLALVVRSLRLLPQIRRTLEAVGAATALMVRCAKCAIVP